MSDLVILVKRGVRWDEQYLWLYPLNRELASALDHMHQPGMVIVQ